MRKGLIRLVGAAMLSFSLAVIATAQIQPTTVAKVTTIQNPDGGAYTIVEYPVGKETIVTLNPVGMSGATGTATILRDPSGTTIKLNLTSLPPEVSSLNVYAVDPSGRPTLLGPVEVSNGVGTFVTTTPLSRFMLVASPEATMTTYDTHAKVIFRSTVPEGLAVIPVGEPVGERVAVAAAEPQDAVPMLGIPAFRAGKDTKFRINFTGVMSGSHANVFIEPRKDGPTKIRLRFHDMKEAPAGRVYVLWVVSPDNQFVKLGQVVSARGRNDAEIRSETSLDDFGLFVSMEDTNGQLISPVGPRVGIIEVIK